ncbi:beta-N-acetylhexosaminidase [Muriicola sp. Z0-33]|uniref:beta-N-acetylhexosaminidase n=1 Tax=Muriicola sp. Z0-33 TaxID=2816957 RepID=UPI002237C5B8|nr:beta-N-acetylhexosaminidase [Muriicola sp. Z0-33]MCW5516378.1 family 20 glycosylhydrolase [Muriicola sp. Z0-33]
MKIFKLIIASFILGAMASCENTTKKLGDFKLLPQAQQFDITGVSDLEVSELKHYYLPEELKLAAGTALLSSMLPVDNTSDAELLLAIDNNSALKSEGYSLTISEHQITINAKDMAGLRYGLMSLEQLVQDAEEQQVNLPLCSIEDFPMLAYRAVQLDVKHHREKKEYYYKIIDKLASYKVNAIILELEDKIKYQRQALVGSEDALSIAEWKDLSEYAMARNIEISPLVQGLGHASFILKHDKYKSLRDDPDSDWAFNPLDPKTYEVQFNLYKDAMEATPYGRYLHVGGDEVHTTGRGSGKSALELQLTWLNKVCKFAEDNDRIPIFWDDMPLKHAGVYRAMFQPELSKAEVEAIWAENEHKLSEFLDLFPKNCIYMRWNYASPQTLGNTKAMDWFQKHGMQVMGATAGQRRWILMPQDGGNLDNIRSFAKSSIEQNLNGLLLTLWDDDSPHFELYWRGILAFAEQTWAGVERDKNELLATYRQREFGHAVSGDNYAFVDQLETPVTFLGRALTKDIDRRQLATTKDPIVTAIIDLPDRNLPQKWSTTHKSQLEQAEIMLAISDSVASKIEGIKNKAIRNRYTLDIYEQVNLLSQFAPKALLALRDYDIAGNEELALAKLKEIRQLKSEFEKIRATLEEVYGQSRILSKPENYILDQDHHTHLANQTRNFDWQFNAEILFLEKLESELLNQANTQ